MLLKKSKSLSMTQSGTIWLQLCACKFTSKTAVNLHKGWYIVLPTTQMRIVLVRVNSCDSTVTNALINAVNLKEQRGRRITKPHTKRGKCREHERWPSAHLHQHWVKSTNVPPQTVKQLLWFILFNTQCSHCVVTWHCSIVLEVQKWSQPAVGKEKKKEKNIWKKSHIWPPEVHCIQELRWFHPIIWFFFPVGLCPQGISWGTQG